MHSQVEAIPETQRLSFTQEILHYIRDCIEFDRIEAHGGVMAL